MSVLTRFTNANEMMRTVSSMLHGRVLPTIRKKKRQIDMWLRADAMASHGWARKSNCRAATSWDNDKLSSMAKMAPTRPTS